MLYYVTSCYIMLYYMLYHVILCYMLAVRDDPLGAVPRVADVAHELARVAPARGLDGEGLLCIYIYIYIYI